MILQSKTYSKNSEETWRGYISRGLYFNQLMCLRVFML